MGIIAVIEDFGHKQKYDDLFGKGYPVKILDKNHGFVHYVTTQLHKVVGPRDFLMLTTKGKMDFGGRSAYVLTARSVEHDDEDVCPPTKNAVRADIKLGGWVLEPLGNNNTRCTYMSCVDMKGSWPLKGQIKKKAQAAVPGAVATIREYLAGRVADSDGNVKPIEIDEEQLARQAAKIRRELD